MVVDADIKKVNIFLEKRVILSIFAKSDTEMCR